MNPMEMDYLVKVRLENIQRYRQEAVLAKLAAAGTARGMSQFATFLLPLQRLLQRVANPTAHPPAVAGAESQQPALMCCCAGGTCCPAA